MESSMFFYLGLAGEFYEKMECNNQVGLIIQDSDL